MATLYPPAPTPVTDQRGYVTRVWLDWFRKLVPAGGAAPAPADGPYVLAGPDGDLPAGRVLTAGANITLTDGGAGGALTIAASGGGGGAPTTATYLTATNETGTLANSRQLLAGTNVTFDDATPGQRTVNATGGAWAPLATGAEPMVFVSDGAGTPAMVAFTP